MVSRDLRWVKDAQIGLWTDKVDQISLIPSPEDKDTTSLRPLAGSTRGKKSLEQPWMDSAIHLDAAWATE
jgi:hypothetical protein